MVVSVIVIIVLVTIVMLMLILAKGYNRMEDYIELPYRNKVQFPISTECDSINITFNHSCSMFIILGSGK